LGNLTNEGANLAKMPSSRWLCKPDRACKVTRKESARGWRPPIFILCQVQMPISLEMTYFYLLHFVMGVCKQQQMSSQFAKAFGDAQHTYMLLPYFFYLWQDNTLETKQRIFWCTAQGQCGLLLLFTVVDRGANE